jgi:hypothetical protein
MKSDLGVGISENEINLSSGQITIGIRVENHEDCEQISHI